MNVFDHALTVLFSDPNMSVSATYTPLGGAPFEVRLIEQFPDDLHSFSEARFVSDTRAFDMMVVEGFEPKAGDLILIGDDQRKVKSAPAREETRRVWRLDTRAA